VIVWLATSKSYSTGRQCERHRRRCCRHGRLQPTFHVVPPLSPAYHRRAGRASCRRRSRLPTRSQTRRLDLLDQHMERTLRKE
jgi:hypothetical protein